MLAEFEKRKPDPQHFEKPVLGGPSNLREVAIITDGHVDSVPRSKSPKLRAKK
jgi:hypothetical protein